MAAPMPVIIDRHIHGYSRHGVIAFVGMGRRCRRGAKLHQGKREQPGKEAANEHFGHVYRRIVTAA